MLASQAKGLKDLIALIGDGDAAADQAAAAIVANRAAAPGGDLARLKPATRFVDDKGRLAWPVSGSVTKNFGDAEREGGQAKGVSLATPPGATVSAPVDGWVAFAGPYRSYGQLLILNAGEGYYMVLAGMERIQVSVGQFVLAGEPVAVMGDGRRARRRRAAIGADAAGSLYRIRKDGTAIDPEPWWAKSNIEKARG